MNKVSLKKYFERILEEHDRAHAAEHKAVELQAAEYQRRLSELNHAHERSLEDRNDFATKEDAERNAARIRELELNQIDRQAYFTDRQNDQEKQGAAAQVVETRLKASDERADLRFKPLERLGSRASLLFPLGTVVGALILYILEKVLH